MGIELTLTAEDGHRLGAYRADPAGEARGGVVVLQEIFGVNAHIREVCDGFARDRYVALAPALFDRSSKKGVQLGYEEGDIVEGRQLREEFSWDETVLDVKAAAELLRGEGLRVGTVGYCWGGSISFLAAVRLDLNAAVVYYGGQIMPYVRERERCPLLMHFGRDDATIPPEQVQAIKAAHPEVTVHIYDGAGHGFNCDHRAAFHVPSSKLARERTLEFFARHLGDR